MFLLLAIDRFDQGTSQQDMEQGGDDIVVEKGITFLLIYYSVYFHSLLINNSNN